MTLDELVAQAQAITSGSPVKKADVVAFMKAFLAWHESRNPVIPTEVRAEEENLQAGGPAMTKEEVQAILPHLPFEIEKTEQGIHVPREANRSYTRAEAASLVALIGKALDITK